jgi:hypothetical protein
MDDIARLARTVGRLPEPARTALRMVADRVDLPLVSGSWRDGAGGCLVANVVTALSTGSDPEPATLDVRVLQLIPELSSRDLNRLIVAWDEAAAALGCRADADLRNLLREALGYRGGGDAPSVASTVSSAPSRTTPRRI